MVLGLFKQRRDRIPYGLYGQIVDQARKPVFYSDFGVEDTVDGRFNAIALHASLVFRRMRIMPEPGLALMQEIFDIFMGDMDQALREMGVGDLSVPKKMKLVAEVFYGAAKAYDHAFEEGDDRLLADALLRNVFGADDPDHKGAPALARYVFATELHLSGISDDRILEGRLEFPEPARFRPT